jgi:CheY-like chemotaxis protein
MKKIDKICLIDDDMIYRYLTQKVITETHLVKRINAFSNGLDAINFLKKEHLHEEKLPDLILLDLFMPVMDGWGFLKEYVKLLPVLTKKIPIYIVSSSIDPADIQKSKAISSVTDFIIKPMTKEGFMHILKNHLSENTSRLN